VSEAHIVTVGTSIVRNAAQRGSLPPGILARVKAWAQAPPLSREDVEAGEAARKSGEEFKALLQLLASEPRVYSAELNAMWPYLERESVAAAALLASDSGASHLCASLLEEYLRASGVECEVHRVPELGRSFEPGLYNLLDTVASLTAKYRERGLRVYLNATGGFKLETAVLYLAACLLGADRVYYIHEAMREVVELPALPLAVDQRFAHALRKLGPEAEREEAERALGRGLLYELERRGLIEALGGRVRARRWVALLLGLS
jgi:putative CRISPR-associated protein (TIGR02619 family)